MQTKQSYLVLSLKHRLILVKFHWTRVYWHVFLFAKCHKTAVYIHVLYLFRYCLDNIGKDKIVDSVSRLNMKLAAINIYQPVWMRCSRHLKVCICNQEMSNEQWHHLNWNRKKTIRLSILNRMHNKKTRKIVEDRKKTTTTTTQFVFSRESLSTKTSE